MPKSLRVQLTISGESVSLSNVFNLSNNALVRAEVPTDEFAAAAADKELAVAVDLSQCTFLSIRPTTDVTLKTNSTSEPGDTKTLAANQGLTWWDGCGVGLDDLFAADITTMYFTNTDAENAGSIAVVVLSDATA